jgi:hypothetical protein
MFSRGEFIVEGQGSSCHDAAKVVARETKRPLVSANAMSRIRRLRRSHRARTTAAARDADRGDAQGLYGVDNQGVKNGR